MSYKMVAMVSLVAAAALFCLASGAGLVGGKSLIEISEVPQNVTDRGTTQLAAQNSFPCAESYQLISAEKQVVAGLNYFLTYKADLTKCGANQSGNQECTVKVFSQAWTKTIEASKPECH